VALAIVWRYLKTIDNIRIFAIIKSGSAMDISAEISWIKSELDKVEDPYLIEIFKSLLRYRQESAYREMDAMIQEGEEDIQAGRLTSHEDFKAVRKLI
jgi:hypothetical protein